MGKVAYVHVDPDGSFSFTEADGSATTITQDPAYVDEQHSAYLDSVPYVERTGDTVDDEPEDDEPEDEEG
jgi:hypothetical protein